MSVFCVCVAFHVSIVSVRRHIGGYLQNLLPIHNSRVIGTLISTMFFPCFIGLTWFGLRGIEGGSKDTAICHHLIVRACFRPLRERSLTPPFHSGSVGDTFSFHERTSNQQTKHPSMRASAVATLFSLAAGASAFTVGGPAIVSRPVSVCFDGFSFPLAPGSKIIYGEIGPMQSMRISLS